MDLGYLKENGTTVVSVQFDQTTLRENTSPLNFSLTFKNNEEMKCSDD